MDVPDRVHAFVQRVGVLQRVHCSRATIYRYAGGKAQIRDAVLTRLAAGVIDTVRCAVDGLAGQDRIVTAITGR